MLSTVRRPSFLGRSLPIPNFKRLNYDTISIISSSSDRVREWPRRQLFFSTPARIWKIGWVVHCKLAGNGTSALKYLAPHVYRVAITNNRIEKLENGQERIRFKNSETCRLEIIILSALAFMLAAGKRRQLKLVKSLLGGTNIIGTTPAQGTQQSNCPCCGTKPRWVNPLPRSPRVPPQQL
jgi:hypothetical protein